MAKVELDAHGLRVRMGPWERLGAFHADVDVPVRCLVGAAVVADVWPQLRGVRAPGTGLPGVIMLGTTRHDGVKDFCVVRRHGPGLVVELRQHEFARLLLSLEAGEATRLATSIQTLLAGES